MLAVKHLIGINLKMKKREISLPFKEKGGKIMNSLAIYFIAGIVVLATSSLAFGATLSTPLEFNLIGASDNVEVGAARANMTGISFITEVSGVGVVETDGINFDVGNEDPLNSHTYEICIVLEGPTGVFNPNSGEAPACTTTSSIPANTVLTSQIINLSNATSVNDLLDISVSIEELT